MADSWSQRSNQKHEILALLAALIKHANSFSAETKEEESKKTKELGTVSNRKRKAGKKEDGKKKKESNQEGKEKKKRKTAEGERNKELSSESLTLENFV